MRFSALFAVSRVVVLAASGIVCGLSNSVQVFGQVGSAAIPAVVPQDGFTSSGLPDAPSSLFKRPNPPPVDANRLLSPEVWSSSDDGNASDGPVTKITIDNINVFALRHEIRKYNHKHQASEDPDNPVTLEGVAYPERYHWGALIAQSYFFNLSESAWRIAMDDQIRYLMAKKPFWHDYVASMKQFNMRRWNDGDDFLVNYIGHPMQGAVSAYIEIQNSPRDRNLEISATHDYWMSRFRGFLWAVAFSTHSEISPLGEAGIGNEGGWTYPIAGCHKPCKQWHPPMHYTNNTGWVDFIITPTVGMLWVLLEDSLDRYVSDRIQGSHIHAVAPKIVRGALNPSRTWANFMRLKEPWYRDWQHDTRERAARPAIHMLRADESPAQERLGRFSIAGHYRSMPLGTYLKSCVLCFAGHGGGFEVEYAVTPWLNASFGLDKQQGLSDKNATEDGTATFTGFGIRLVHDRPHNTFSLVVRPGMVLDQAVMPAHLDVATGKYIPEKSSSMNHTAGTLLAANDYKINRNFAVRTSLGVVVVRYKTNVVDPPAIGKPPYLSWLSHENFTNHTTWVWQGGPVVRF
ncbi:MAG TPA: hypothetical protein VF214_00175 [Edaphobacter sp.]